MQFENFETLYNMKFFEMCTFIQCANLCNIFKLLGKGRPPSAGWRPCGGPRRSSTPASAPWQPVHRRRRHRRGGWLQWRVVRGCRAE